MMIVVSDATPLIALATINHLTLLVDLFGGILIPLLAKRQGRITGLRPLLDELKAKKFHLSEHVRQAVLKQAGE